MVSDRSNILSAPVLRIALALLLCVTSVIAIAALGQSRDEKKRKQEKFGSSLKRLKWDSKRNRAVEKKTEKKPGGIASQSDGEAIKLDTLFVALDVLVSDPATSRFVTGLSRDDFIVTEDGSPQQVSTFALGDGAERPRSIVLIFDYSGSQLPYLTASIEAAKTLISQLAPADEMAIVTDDVELLAEFTRDKGRLLSTLDLLEKRVRKIAGEDKFGRSISSRRGKSLQFSALFAALREMVEGDDARPVIIFQTDGDEAVTLRDQPDADDYRWNMPKREFGLADVYTAAERSRATIYTVIPAERLAGLEPGALYERGREMLTRAERSRFETDEEYQRHSSIFPLSEAKVKLLTDRFARAQQAAARMAELTGGWTAYLERPEQALDIYARILSDINHRYILGYYPTNTARDGRLRRLRIEVRGHPEYTVHGRSSYYAPL
jgi:VWFA-related protein